MADSGELPKTILTLVVGGVIGWLSKYLERRQAKVEREQKYDVAIELRSFDSMESMMTRLQGECDALKKEVDEWRSMYFALMDKNRQLQERVFELSHRLESEKGEE